MPAAWLGRWLGGWATRTYMPVNPLPILIPLLLVWGALAYFLFRWRRLAGAAFVGSSVASIIVVLVNTGVERQFDEEMTYGFIEVGDYRTLTLTNSHGDSISGGSAAVVARLKQSRQPTVQVVMTGWYDFGRLRAYRVYRIDGDLQ